MSPAVISELKIHKNVLAAGDLLQTPMGELTALPQTPSCILGRGWKRNEGGEKVGPDQVWEKLVPMINAVVMSCGTS